MMYVIIKSMLFNRWSVYSVGHLEGDRTWLATFLNFADAAAWIGQPHLSPGESAFASQSRPERGDSNAD